MRSFLKLSALSLLVTAGITPALFARAEPEKVAPAVVDPDNVPCRIVQAVKPMFPALMMNEGVSQGSVHLMLYVDATGALTDSLVTAYTRKAFADEVAPLLGKWKFAAGRVKGEAVDTIIDLTIVFELDGISVVQHFAPEAVLDAEPRPGFEYQAARVQDLDRVPTPLHIVEPTYPREWMNQGITGSVSVDFFIDETGRIRFPRVVASEQAQLEGIALAAVQQWRFVPPKAKGQSVLVHARQVFEFEKTTKP